MYLPSRCARILTPAIIADVEFACRNGVENFCFLCPGLVAGGCSFMKSLSSALHAVQGAVFGIAYLAIGVLY
jgi:hypothetical protein